MPVAYTPSAGRALSAFSWRFFVKNLFIIPIIMLVLSGCSSMGPQLLTLRDGTQFITSGAVEFNRASRLYEYVDSKGRTVLLEPDLIRSVEPYRPRK